MSSGHTRGTSAHSDTPGPFRSGERSADRQECGGGDMAAVAQQQAITEALLELRDGASGALVHEAYLRLVDQTRAEWADRAQFFAVAAHVMRRVLVDHARRHATARRGGGRRRTISIEALESADSVELAAGDRADVLLAMDEALERLAVLDPRQARVVDCRFFGGLTEAETAEALGVTARTVTRDWVKARGWLYRELRDDAP